MNMQRNNLAGRKLLVAAMLASAGAALPQVAIAQQADTTSAANAEIIVTAQRREERAQDVPISITAVSAEGLRERSVTNLQGLQSQVPSLVIAPNGQASRDVMSPSIRGQSASFQGSPAVVVYMNEVPLPAGYTLSSQGGPGNFVDLQNVQVLSGVQGTLFGRNTTGGAILLTPAKPTDKLEGYLSGGFGNYNMTEFEGVLNVPVSDKLKVRLVGQARDRDGFTQDVRWNKDRDDQHTRMGRLGVQFDPTDTISNYTMAYYGYSRSNGSGSIAKSFNTTYFQQLDQLNFGGFRPFDFCRTAGNCNYYNNLIADQTARGNRKTAHGVDDFAKIETWGINNTTDIDLTDNLKLRNIISYAELKSYYSNDQDGTIAPVYNTGTTIESRTAPRDWFKQFTEEVQFQGTALEDKLTYTVGGFYFKNSPKGKMESYSINVCSNPTETGCSIGYATIAPYSESKALYAQATLDLGALTPALERLRLTGGYRYTWDTVGGTNISYSYTPTAGVVGPAANTVLSCSWKTAFTVNEKDCEFGSELKSKAPNWTVGLDYRVNEDLMLYAKVTKGYKAGGFNSYAVYESTRTFGPENLTDYEAGFKSDFKVGGMETRLNVNGFWLDYANIQRAAGDRNMTTGGNGAITLSTATAEIKGVEIEAMIKPIEQLEIGGNYSHVSSRYKSFKFNSTSGVYDCTVDSINDGKVYGAADMTCRPLQYLSPNIFSVYGRLAIPTAESFGNVSLFVTYAWTDAQETAPFSRETFPDGTINEPGVRLPSFGLLNASLDWKNALNSGLDVTVFGTNLTNKEYAITNTGTYQTIGAQTQMYGEPRMYGIRLKYAFGN